MFLTNRTYMKQNFAKWTVVLLCTIVSWPATAQFNLKKALSGAAKAAQAVTLTDEQMAAYVKEYIDWMDANNPVCEADDPCMCLQQGAGIWWGWWSCLLWKHLRLPST